MSDPNQPGYPPPGSGQPDASGQPPQPTHPPQPSEPKIAFSIGQILGAILFILLIIFIVENSHPVQTRIIVGPEVHPPLWLIIVISAVLGALIAELLRYRRRASARRKAQLRAYKSDNR